jgi:predicted nucleotidyltransferase
VAASHPEVLRIGYFGSYARGDSGVGSDVDVVIIVGDAAPRACPDWGTTSLPVAADVLVYTEEEWRQAPRSGRFGQTLKREAVWVYERSGPTGGHADVGHD